MEGIKQSVIYMEWKCHNKTPCITSIYLKKKKNHTEGPHGSL
jgi:hypothetical protein